MPIRLTGLAAHAREVALFDGMPVYPSSFGPPPVDAELYLEVSRAVMDTL